jgi:mRNA-degrading endonuclease toxin of MazEF toxin-antitoxin module
MKKKFQRRDVFMVDLPQKNPPGHEQHGYRPVVILSSFDSSRYSTVIVVPLSQLSSMREGWVNNSPNLYPVLLKGSGGLTKDSIVLLDQITSIDSSRIQRYLGSLTLEEYKPIAEGVQTLFKDVGDLHSIPSPVPSPTPTSISS